jgi:hypothetical protein
VVTRVAIAALATVFLVVLLMTHPPATAAKAFPSPAAGATVFSRQAGRDVLALGPTTPAWFEVAVDKSTLRTLDLRMIANGHFMHDVYAFRAVSIRPPHSRSHRNRS